jgi:hypothetical protein
MQWASGAVFFFFRKINLPELHPDHTPAPDMEIKNKLNFIFSTNVFMA